MDIIRTLHYIQGALGDENILLFYVCNFAMGLTHCYKTTVFLHLLLLLLLLLLLAKVTTFFISFFVRKIFPRT